MKIKDVVQEGVYDWFGNLNAQRKQRNAASNANMKVVPNEVKQMFITAMRANPYEQIETLAPKILSAIKAKGVSTADAQEMINDVMADIKIDQKYSQGAEAERQAAQKAGQHKQDIDAQVGSIIKSHPSRTPPAPTPSEGMVLQVDGPGGQQYFKNFQGRWFQKFGPADEFSGTHEVKNPDDVKALDNLATQKSKKIPVIPDSLIPGKFIVDRRAKLDKARAARKQRAGV